MIIDWIPTKRILAKEQGNRGLFKIIKIKIPIKLNPNINHKENPGISGFGGIISSKFVFFTKGNLSKAPVPPGIS